MDIDISKHRDDLLGWFLIHCVSKKMKEVFPEPNTKHFDVKLTANGVELPLLETFAEIDRQMESMIKKKALELIKEKFDDRESRIYDLFSIIEQHLIKIGREELDILEEEFEE